MAQQQQVSATDERRRANVLLSPARLLTSLCVGIAIACVLTLLEVLVLLVLSPGFVSSRADNHGATLLSLSLHTPLVWLLPLVELVVGTLVALVAMQPLALIAYMRKVRLSYEANHKLYLPLLMRMSIYKAEQQNAETAHDMTQEQPRTLLDVIETENASLVIVGAAGMGKTVALRIYHYRQSFYPLQHIKRGGRISLYVSLSDYALFLKYHAPPEGAANTATSLFDFLATSDLPGMRHLRPYLKQFAEQGRLLLLCDGLNEVKGNARTAISRELVQLMRTTSNRLIVTCREIEYRELYDLVQVVHDGYAANITLYLLQVEQITDCVEKFIEQQGKEWRHTAGQILQVIDRTRLRYLCTNPMLLLMFLHIIDTVGVGRGRQLDTRGLLLREFVHQSIIQEQLRPHWNANVPDEQELMSVLSVLACAARWTDEPAALQVLPSAAAAKEAKMLARAQTQVLTEAIRPWLRDHPARGPFEDGEESANLPYEGLPHIIQLARSAGFLEINQTGSIRFQHALLADYFVAEYCYAADAKEHTMASRVRKELLEQIGVWCEPVALWADLLENPLPLVDRFMNSARAYPAAALRALVLSLISLGGLWKPPQEETPPALALPPRVSESLTAALHNKAACEELARIFLRCAQEGGQEVYRTLLPLLMVEGVDELLILLDKQLVPDLLFAQLQDIVDNTAYEAQVRRITKVLGRFGNGVVERAAQLSQPIAGRSARLRAAAMNILGGTESYRAVEPLIACLSDSDPALVKRAANALAHLGPELTLARVLQTLENRAFGSVTQSVHQATLALLEYFLDEQDVRRQLSLAQYQRVIEMLVPVLTSSYQAEPIVQPLARRILVKQARLASHPGALDVADQRWEKVLATLIRYLPSQDEMAAHNVVLALQEVGQAATPLLLEALSNASELVRLRIIDVLRVLHDIRALPSLLQMLGNASVAIQQEAAKVLYLYAPESIAGLIDLVLTGENEAVAERAANILCDIGQEAIEPVTNVLFHVVPERTRLLVRVLERIHEPTSLPALLALLQMPHIDSLLMVTVIRALSQFPDARVVSPLLSLLSDTRPQIYEEAINTLSLLGLAAYEGLIAALDVVGETTITQRVERALLGMVPFPGEQLLETLAQCTAAQAQHIVALYRLQGVDAAQNAVKHLLHPDPRVRGYIHQALEGMVGPLVVPPLLDLLSQAGPLRDAASMFLLKYPDAAIVPLVALLGEDERGDVAALLLPQFGVRVLHPLISGLDDQRSSARERARTLLVTLVRQSYDADIVLRAMVQLFNPAPPVRAHEMLLEVLTKELANESIPALLEGLEDAHLLNDCADALVRLSRRPALQQEVLDRLIQALYIDERRAGAEMALTKIGAPAVIAVGQLIVDEQPAVAKTAKRILRTMGTPALSFIWEAYNNTTHRALREAALEVFHSMPTDVIKDELVMLLSSDRQTDISMAVALLLERMRDEATRQYADRAMIPELLEYVQTHSVEETNLRILSLLLLLGERVLLRPLLETLDVYPDHRPQLGYMLLLLGAEAQKAMLHAFINDDMSLELRSELAALLGMLTAPPAVIDYVRNLSSYGLGPDQSIVLYTAQLQLALRALGGLLASGQWDVATLEELRDAVPEGEPTHELYSVLLGVRYEPQIQQLQQEMQKERDAHKKEILALTARIVADQRKLQNLEEELEQMRSEHGMRGDELFKTAQEKDMLYQKLDQITQDREKLRSQLAQALRENDLLRDQNEQLQWHLDQSQGR
jgi:HEAT repeat protein